MSKKIAVIGGGIFGVVTAINFAKHGFKTDLYEQNSDILMGATANSQNRLHLGLHYPRDLDTAIQSKLGFIRFREAFPAAINSNFPNYYSVSSKNSKVNEKEFLNFANKAGIELREVSNHEITKCGIKIDKISTVYECQEAVIDINKLREILRIQISDYGVNLKVDQKVSRLKAHKKLWEISTLVGEVNSYDLVFKATYGSDHIVDEFNSVKRTTYEYHATLILEIRNPYKNFGFTVIDGDFITLLPRGFSNNQLLYAPSISTRKRHTGESIPIEWMNEENLKLTKNLLLDRLNFWFAGYENIEVVSMMQAFRAIQPNMERTDRRTSSIKQLNRNYFEMWSGKIDHCIDMADELLNLVKK